MNYARPFFSGGRLYEFYVNDRSTVLYDRVALQSVMWGLLMYLYPLCYIMSEIKGCIILIESIQEAW